MGIDTSWWDGELQIIIVSRGGLTTPKSSSQKSKATRSFGPSKQIIHQMRNNRIVNLLYLPNISLQRRKRSPPWSATSITK